MCNIVRSQDQVGHDGLNACDTVARSQDVAKHLGVLWDSQTTMINQIANVCKTSILHLRNIMKIKKVFFHYSLKVPSSFVCDQ